MFSGIVQQKGRIISVERTGGFGRLVVQATPWAQPVEKSESIAVNGVCLTVTGVKNDNLYFDILNETFERTNLGEKKIGQHVNLERALRVGDPLGGHIVTGHVDGVGRVRAVKTIERDHILEVACSRELMDGLVEKGSIACDGISLTVVDVMPDAFTVHLIPFTWENTAISEVRVGDGINLETDMLGKYVRKIVTGRGA